MRFPLIIMMCCNALNIQGTVVQDIDRNTDDVTRENLLPINSRIFRKSEDIAILNQPTTVSDDSENTHDVTGSTEKVHNADVTTDTIIIEPRILQKNTKDQIEVLNQPTTVVDENTDDVTEVASTTEPLIIIEPRKLDNDEILGHVNMHDIDYEMAKDLKIVRQIDESRQQNFRYVNCNDNIAPLAGTSIDKFYVVQSPKYPQNYPVFLWCDYKFAVPVNSQVIVKVLAMDVDCPYDFVEMGKEGANALVTLCPLGSVKTTYTMLPEPAAYNFRITFKSNWDPYTFSGFQMLVYLNQTIPTTTTAPTRPTSTPTLPPISGCTCGKWNSKRIVGGFVAAPNAFPYQIGLMRNTSTQPFCGGTLISPNFVLTAAHCTVSFLRVNGLRVSIGDVNYQVKDEGEQFIPVLRIIPHPNYNSTNQNFDYSLLQLASPINASKYAAFACLPPDLSQTFEGTNMTITGWGRISSSGEQSPPLKAAFVTGLSNDACRATPYKSLITSNMICAAAPGTDACQGDSGGPMVANVNGRVTLVGVTSFGIGCANATFPGVYSRVSAQRDWILANTDAGRCQN